MQTCLAGLLPEPTISILDGNRNWMARVWIAKEPGSLSPLNEWSRVWRDGPFNVHITRVGGCLQPLMRHCRCEVGKDDRGRLIMTYVPAWRKSRISILWVLTDSHISIAAVFPTHTHSGFSVSQDTRVETWLSGPWHSQSHCSTNWIEPNLLLPILTFCSICRYC